MTATVAQLTHSQRYHCVLFRNEPLIHRILCRRYDFILFCVHFLLSCLRKNKLNFSKWCASLWCAVYWRQIMVDRWRVVENDDPVIDVMRVWRERAWKGSALFRWTNVRMSESPTYIYAAHDPHENSFSEFFTIRIRMCFVCIRRGARKWAHSTIVFPILNVWFSIFNATTFYSKYRSDDEQYDMSESGAREGGERDSLCNV